jgi:hypothetical protein
MQQQQVLLQAALLLRDFDAAEQSLAYLREHGQAALATLQTALFRAGREQEAAQVLIGRLEDPFERRQALLEVQDYSSAGESTFERLERRRQEAWLRRPDIQAEIARVGRRERVLLPRG